MSSGPAEDPTTIECPNCGERVYYEVSTCPNCGLPFYQDEEESQPEPTVEAGHFQLSAVVVGWLVATAVGFLIHFLAGRVWSPDGVTNFGRIVILLAAPAGSLAGGFLTGSLAGGRLPVHGLLVGLLSIVPAVLFDAYWRDLAQQWITPLALVGYLATAGAGFLGGWLAARVQSTRRVSALFGTGRKRGEHQLYLDLLARVRHDFETADRLIALEQTRKPHAGRAAWIRDAIDRLDHDRR